MQCPSSGENAAASTPSVSTSGQRRPASVASIIQLRTPSSFCSATSRSNAATCCAVQSRNRYPTRRRSISWPGRSANRPKASRLRAPSSMLSRSANWARTPPAALLVEPEPSSARSSSSTSVIPASARWKATLTPITPPPMITTSARPGSSRARPDTWPRYGGWPAGRVGRTPSTDPRSRTQYFRDATTRSPNALGGSHQVPTTAPDLGLRPARRGPADRGGGGRGGRHRRADRDPGYPIGRPRGTAATASAPAVPCCTSTRRAAPTAKTAHRAPRCAPSRPALDQATPGTQITLAPGVYREQLATVRDGTPDAPITIKGPESGTDRGGRYQATLLRHRAHRQSSTTAGTGSRASPSTARSSWPASRTRPTWPPSMRGRTACSRR